MKNREADHRTPRVVVTFQVSVMSGGMAHNPALPGEDSEEPTGCHPKLTSGELHSGQRRRTASRQPKWGKRRRQPKGQAASTTQGSSGGVLI